MHILQLPLGGGGGVLTTHTRQNCSTSVPGGLTHGASLLPLGWAAAGRFVISWSFPSGDGMGVSGQP